MKSFEQACEAVFVVKTESDIAQVSAAQERHSGTIAMVVESRQATMLTDMFYRLHHQHNMKVELLIKNAFAQGVAVGLEMNREVPFAEIGTTAEVH